MRAAPENGHTRHEDEMIEAIIGIYLLAWWGVFMLLMPGRSLVRVWAFVPAVICAFGIPMAVWDFVRNPNLAMSLWAIGGLLPFGLLAVLLIKQWNRRKQRPNQAVHAIGASAPQHDG
jgi:hypothetical protein